MYMYMYVSGKAYGQECMIHSCYGYRACPGTCTYMYMFMYKTVQHTEAYDIVPAYDFMECCIMLVH